MLMKAAHVRQTKPVEMVSFEVDGKAYSIPKQPSDLIRWALRDMWQGLNSGELRIDMRMWYKPANGLSRIKCVGCFAGAVMWGFFGPRSNEFSWLGAGNLRWLDSTGLPKTLTCRLAALNCFRVGMVRQGLLGMGLGISAHRWKDTGFCFAYGSAIETKPELRAFSRDMLLIARKLQKAGL